ncbi:MAG: heme o synthase [Bacteriovoracaceae bacterium]|nr:heme o synthase [Bacteriovoracaceae bacterium]
MNVLFYLLYGGTIILLLVGAQLQVLKSALVCPDWPLCFGEFLPLTMSPAFYESLHRFIAGLVGLGSIGWAVVRFKDLKARALLPLFIIIIQSLLGWATFYYKLPTITTVLHLVFSLVFLATLEGTRFLHFDEKLKEHWNPKLKDAVGFFLFVLLVQVLLGGILRKSSLLAQCESTMEFWQCWEVQSQIPLAGSLSLMHRVLGLLTTLSGFFVFSYLIKNLPKWKSVAVIGNLLMVTQLLLGLQMGRSASREMIIWHFATALGSFLVLLFLIVRLRRYEKYFFGKALPTYLNDLMDLFKPKLTILVVITLLVGVFLAPLKINIILLFISLIAIWLQAAGSLSLNCYIERDADKLMERTKDRPLPAGRLKPEVALYWGWGLILTGTLILLWSANLLTAGLGLFSALSYIYIYTPLKLKTPYALYIGAVPGALPTLMGWTTVTNSVNGEGIYLFGILFLWQIPHFMAISLYRKNEYGMASFLTFAQTHSFEFLRTNIVIYSFIMMLFGMIPYFAGWRGDIYFWAATFIGAILLGVALLGFRIKNQENINNWARSYFWATLFYLPLILGVLLVLR